jgi:hypothetical protein
MGICHFYKDYKNKKVINISEYKKEKKKEDKNKIVAEIIEKAKKFGW